MWGLRRRILALMTLRRKFLFQKGRDRRRNVNGASVGHLIAIAVQFVTMITIIPDRKAILPPTPLMQYRLLPRAGRLK